MIMVMVHCPRHWFKNQSYATCDMALVAYNLYLRDEGIIIQKRPLTSN